jgi:hypothetical protein
MLTLAFPLYLTILRHLANVTDSIQDTLAGKSDKTIAKRINLHGR